MQPQIVQISNDHADTLVFQQNDQELPLSHSPVKERGIHDTMLSIRAADQSPGKSPGKS